MLVTNKTMIVEAKLYFYNKQKTVINGYYMIKAIILSTTISLLRSKKKKGWKTILFSTIFLFFALKNVYAGKANWIFALGK